MELKNRFIILAAILLLVVISAATSYWLLIQPRQSSNYQAVFLSNGQVYFGKLTRRLFAPAVLNDVYYLILRQPLQQQMREENQEEQQSAGYTLIKLGKEIHGPRDEMRINPRHILFVEDLNPDGKVVQAIIQYQENPQE